MKKLVALLVLLLVPSIALAATVGDNMTFEGSVTHQGSVTNNGAVTSNGAQTFGSTVTVTGATTLNSTLAVSGTSSYTGAAALNGGITVDNTNFTVSGTTGAVATASTLAVADASTLTGTVNAIGDIDLGGDLIGDGGGTITGMSMTASAKTADYSPTAADVGTVFHNTGAGGAVNFGLIGCVAGYHWGFAVVETQNVVINPDDADQILGLTDAAGDSITSAAAGDYIELTCLDATSIVITGTSDTNAYTTSWADTN